MPRRTKKTVKSGHGNGQADLGYTSRLRRLATFGNQPDLLTHNPLIRHRTQAFSGYIINDIQHTVVRCKSNPSKSSNSMVSWRCFKFPSVNSPYRDVI